jgi:hypothetical protein
MGAGLSTPAIFSFYLSRAMTTATETKGQAWRRLAVTRSRKANKYMQSLCKLCNRSHYEWTDKTVQALMVLLFRSVLLTCEKYKVDPVPLFETAQRHNQLGLGFDR